MPFKLATGEASGLHATKVCHLCGWWSFSENHWHCSSQGVFCGGVRQIVLSDLWDGIAIVIASSLRDLNSCPTSAVHLYPLLGWVNCKNGCHCARFYIFLLLLLEAEWIEGVWDNRARSITLDNITVERCFSILWGYNVALSFAN